jgi:hypothetical protein
MISMILDISAPVVIQFDSVRCYLVAGSSHWRCRLFDLVTRCRLSAVACQSGCYSIKFALHQNRAP